MNRLIPGILDIISDWFRICNCCWSYIN